MKSVRVGFGSYFGDNCYFERTEIGRYCCIARNVNVVAGHHPIKTYVSMHPAFFSMSQFERFGYVTEQKYKELSFVDDERRVAVKIGNDVWIGAGATIMEGVTIGDGAVIGANALVTKNVAPYEVVVGIPAQHLKFRFDEETRLWLLRFKWWERDEDWIRKNADYFEDIDIFRDINRGIMNE